jgi:hypothetical protein
VSAQTTRQFADFVFKIADKLRGPYRPPQYRRVMLPMTVLRRLDAVLEPTKDSVVAEYERLKRAGEAEAIIHHKLTRIARPGSQQPLWNTSPYTFKRLLHDPDHLARNLVSYIRAFSPKVQEVFERFVFEAEIEKLDASNRLFLVVKEFAAAELGPDKVSNIQMGYVFEELVRRFNEQANEEAGDHFTPREVIRLMTHILYTGEEDIYRPGIVRTIYDPACGTGGMLSVSEEYIREHNPQAKLEPFGQDYNDESWAICCSDLLIKDEPIDNIVKGDTLGDGKSRDGHEGRRFHYMLANPPFGVEWKAQKDAVEKEHQTHTFGRVLLRALPRDRDDEGHRVEEDVELQYYRLQKISEGAIDLSGGEAAPLKGPSEAGTGHPEDKPAPLSEVVEQLNERFGTQFDEADRLFFEQVAASASADEELQAAARANTAENFAYVFRRALERLFVDRMDGNEQIVRRIMADPAFKETAGEFLMREVYERIRNERPS